jgi:hypothetical protein
VSLPDGAGAGRSAGAVAFRDTITKPVKSLVRRGGIRSLIYHLVTALVLGLTMGVNQPSSTSEPAAVGSAKAPPGQKGEVASQQEQGSITYLECSGAYTDGDSPFTTFYAVDEEAQILLWMGERGSDWKQPCFGFNLSVRISAGEVESRCYLSSPGGDINEHTFIRRTDGTIMIDATIGSPRKPLFRKEGRCARVTFDPAIPESRMF